MLDFTMEFRPSSLPRLKDRTLRHHLHLIDNSEPLRRILILNGKRNSFPYERTEDEIIIYPSLESHLEEDLGKVIHALNQIYGLPVSLKSFPFESIQQNLALAYAQEITTELRFYQTPKEPEFYKKKLAKFNNTPFSFRRLDEKDIPALTNLLNDVCEYRRSLIKDGESQIVTRPVDIDIPKMRRSLIMLSDYLAESYPDYFEEDSKEEIEISIMIEGSEEGVYLPRPKSKEEYERLMKHCLTRFYGVFLGEKLVAYSIIEGNDSFAVFHNRAGIKMNGRSPQECLDLHVYQILAEQGVPVIDRGHIGNREGVLGLIKYKEKFGSLSLKLEADFNRIIIANASALEYLRRNKMN